VKYGQELLELLEVELRDAIARANARHEQILNGDMELNDCFRSVSAADASISLLRDKIGILRYGGLSEFPELCRLDGTPAGASLVNTRYGSKWLVTHPGGRNEWVDPFVQEKTLARKGYKIVCVPKPAWAVFRGNGTCIFPSDRNYWTGEEVS
jgi:hypothetical protein